MKQSELNNKIFDQVLQYAAEKEIDDLCSDLPSEEDLKSKITFSPSFENKMDRLFKYERRKQSYKRFGKSALRVAAVIFVLLAASTTVIFSVEAFRVPFLNLFSVTKKDSTTINVENKTVDYKAFSEQAKGLFLPSYIPEGYTVKSVAKFGPVYEVSFADSKGNIISLKKLPGGTSLGVDSENAKVENITINNAQAQYYEKGDIHNLVFKLNENAYFLTGYLSQNEMIHIAESMKLYNQ